MPEEMHDLFTGRLCADGRCGGRHEPEPLHELFTANFTLIQPVLIAEPPHHQKTNNDMKGDQQYDGHSALSGTQVVAVIY